MAAPNLNALLAVILKQIQKAENALAQVILVRFLGFAEGVNLDAIGRLVGEPRLGKLDPAYRIAIRLRIFINGSKGTPEDIIHIARELTGLQVVNYIDVTNGNYRLSIPDWVPDDGTIFAFLQSVSPSGVRLLGITADEPLGYFRMGDRVSERLYH